MRIWSLVLALLITLNAQAQTGREAIEIQADSLEVNQKTGVALFKKNVEVVQKDLRLESDVLEVFYNKDREISKAEESAISAAIDRVEARGHVHFIFKGDEAFGAVAEYDILDQKVYLKGDVTLKRGENVLKGSNLVYNLRTGAMNLDGNSTQSGRVRARFITPKK